MTPDSDGVRTWDAPSPKDIGQTVQEFLRQLGGPTWIRLPGQDRSRTRAISTLLHGNEPSGVRALHRWIQSGQTPLFDLVCFVGAVEAALAPPGFVNRALPGHHDLNRCFREPFDSPDGKIAEAVLQRLDEPRPEALIDLHNTSGRSPAYAVSTRLGRPWETLTSFFSEQLILTDLRLGTLMEATEDTFPTLTVECGGASNPESDKVAFEGITRYALAPSVLEPDGVGRRIQVLKHPIRVELRAGATIAYQPTVALDVDLTLRLDIDQYNFGVVKPGEVIGWTGSKGLDVLLARDAKGRDRTHEVLGEEDGRLHVARPARLFMTTTNSAIATSDCVFYLLPVDDTV